MNFSKEQLEAIEEMAYLLISTDVMAINLEVDELSLKEAISEIGSDAYKAYMRGYGRQLIELRQSVVKAALNGSNPAQQQLQSLMTEFESKMPL